MFVCLGIAMALVIAGITAFGPKTAGRSLEQVNDAGGGRQPCAAALTARAARP